MKIDPLIGKPVIDEKNQEPEYRYPFTPLTDIQHRPNLPSPPIEVPQKYHTYLIYRMEISGSFSEELWEKTRESEKEHRIFWRGLRAFSVLFKRL